MLGDGCHAVCKPRMVRVREYMSLSVSLRVEKGWQRRIHPQSVLKVSALSSTSLGSPSLHVESRQSKVARLTS
jgi:hypothetical protein